MTAPADRSSDNQTDDSDAAVPDEAAVRAQLGRILGSSCFERSVRHKSFLSFVVNETLSGRRNRLKAYTIALDVFQRPKDFDSQTDPLIRVEAGRLRRRLFEYYHTDGKKDPVSIELPLGQYAPVFHYTQPVSELATRDGRAAASDAGDVRRARSFRTATIFATIGAMAIGIIWTALHYQSGPEIETLAVASDSSSASLTPVLPSARRIMILPFATLSGSGDEDYFADGITEEILSGLNRFNVLYVIDSTSWQYSDGALPVPGDEVDADYMLTGSLRRAADQLRVFVRLIDVDTGVQLWTGTYELSVMLETTLTAQESIADQVITAIAMPYGAIYEHEYAASRTKTIDQLDVFDCVFKLYYFWQTIDPGGHKDAGDCFKRVLMRQPDLSLAWAGLALIYVEEYLWNYNPEPELGDPLDRALEAARTALDYYGDGYLANLAMLNIRFAQGDPTTFARALERILPLSNANDPGGRAWIGMLLALSGEWDRGIDMIERAYAEAPDTASQPHVALALNGIRTGNYGDALTWALRLDAPDWFFSKVLVAATAGLAGREDLAARGRDQLLALYPGYPAAARNELGKLQLEGELFDRVIAGLEAAGLDIPPEEI